MGCLALEEREALQRRDITVVDEWLESDKGTSGEKRE